MPWSSRCPMPMLWLRCKIPLLFVILHPLAKHLADHCCLHPGLGLGRTLHSEPAKAGEVTRKGISCERTFAAISSREDLEAKVGAAALRAAINRTPLVTDCLTHQHSRHAVHSPCVATGQRTWPVWSLQATAVCFVHASHHACDSDTGQAAQLPPPGCSRNQLQFRCTWRECTSCCALSSDLS